MKFLLDTNLISEWVRVHPNPGVVEWLAQADEDELFISVITLAELRRGIERMKPGRRRDRLYDWLRNDLLMRFEGRVLSVDQTIAEFWGRIVAHSEAAGRRIGAMDGFIAATAEANSLALVTRNEGDFRHSVSSIINPWIGK